MCKVGLTAYDTKRLLCEDIIHTHAHGHRSTLLWTPILSTYPFFTSPSLSLSPYSLTDASANQIASHDLYTYVASIAIRTLLQ